MAKLRIQGILIASLTTLIFSACSAASVTPSAEEASAPPETASPAASQSAEKSAYPVEITDFLGETSVVESADIIISLSPSGTEVLMALGAEDRIVAVDASSESMLPGIETAGDYTDPDVEKITALEPDLVVAANYIQIDAIEQLRELGITVIAAEPTTWEQVPESFEMIGRAVARVSEASDLSDQLASAVDDVQRAAPQDPVSCYYVLSYGNAGNWTSGEGSFVNTMMAYAGGRPVTAGTASTWLEYPIEDLAANDPDCIILASSAGTIEDFANTAGYSGLAAVQSGNVYMIDEALVSVPGPSLTEGLKEFSAIFQESAEKNAAEAA